MNRNELMQLTADRVVDAEALLAAGRWSAAYYLAGYAVVCGLKACVLAFVERSGMNFFDQRFAEELWTHDVEALVKAAGLEVQRRADVTSNADLGQNWDLVKEWNESSRYEQKTEADARQLFEAINGRRNGVLRWIRVRW